MPAACQPADVVQPLRQHDQLMSCGSLYKSNTTPEIALKVPPTELQKAGE